MFNFKPTPQEWNELMLDMPFTTPHSSSTMDEAFNTPGCCLKSKERADGGWPKHFGKLAKAGDEFVVLAMRHSESDPVWVWAGSKDDYYRDWLCD